MKHKHILTVLVVLFIVGIGFLVLSRKAIPQNESSAQSLKIGMVTFPGYAPLFIARDRNLYGNTHVELVFIESIGELRAALESGRIDAYAATYDMFLSVKDRKPQGKSFLAIDESRGADGLIGPKNIRTPADFKGEAVGTEPGFPAYLILQSFLHSEGLTLQDVRFKDISSKDIPSAYLSRAIQIGGTYEPYLSEILSKSNDSHVVVSSKGSPGLIVDFLWASDQAFQEKQEALRNVAWGYFQAVELMKSSPDEAFGIAANAFQVSLEEMKSFQDGLAWPDRTYNETLLVQEGEGSAYEKFVSIGDILRDNGETNLTLNPQDHITGEILGQVR